VTSLYVKVKCSDITFISWTSLHFGSTKLHCLVTSRYVKVKCSDITFISWTSLHFGSTKLHCLVTSRYVKVEWSEVTGSQMWRKHLKAANRYMTVDTIFMSWHPLGSLSCPSNMHRLLLLLIRLRSGCVQSHHATIVLAPTITL